MIKVPLPRECYKNDAIQKIDLFLKITMIRYKLKMFTIRLYISLEYQASSLAISVVYKPISSILVMTNLICLSEEAMTVTK